ADGPPRRRPGRHLRRAASQARRGGRRRGRAEGGPERRRGSPARLRRPAPGGLQGAAHDPLHGRDPQGRHGQAAAHRAGPEAGPGRMKIAIYGAGAIGGYLGALLADAGAEVTLIARGPHLAAIRDKGLTLEMGGETTVRRIAATDDPAEAGPQDHVIVAL